MVESSLFLYQLFDEEIEDSAATSLGKPELGQRLPLAHGTPPSQSVKDMLFMAQVLRARNELSEFEKGLTRESKSTSSPMGRMIAAEKETTQKALDVQKERTEKLTKQ